MRTEALRGEFTGLQNRLIMVFEAFFLLLQAIRVALPCLVMVLAARARMTIFFSKCPVSRKMRSVPCRVQTSKICRPTR